MTPAARQTAWIEDPDLFMAMEDLELVARGVVEGALHGIHRSPYIGVSVEFESHREYQKGDDLRHVNWDLWARSDRLFVKQFEADTNLNLYIMLDVSGSMLTEHGPARKWRYGARAAAALAFLALTGRDATGVYLLHNRVVESVPPRVRPGQFHEIASLLTNASVEGEADISLAMEEARQLCRRRGIVLLISDLFDREEEILKGLDNFRYMGHEVIVVQALDPWEHEMPERGQYEFHDLETGEKLQTNTAEIRDSYNALVAAWRASFKRHCEESGVDWVPCLTTDPLRDVLIDYLLKRAKMY